MPFSSRGAQYYANALSFLSCRIDHEKMAKDLYSKILKNKEPFGKTNCENCGAYITVSIRGLEWESKIFERGPSKER